MTSGSGVIFVAAGKLHIEAACEAARSVRKHSPSLPIDIFTNEPGACDFAFDQVHSIMEAHRRSKVDYIHLSRFMRTLYLDNDIRVVEDISDVFDLLDRFDIAAAHAHARNRAAVKSVWRLKIPDAFPQLNSGVILFNATPEVLHILREWQKYFHEAGFRKDQVVLRELLWKSNLRVYVLPPEYNIRYKKYLFLRANKELVPRILHFHSFHPDSRWNKIFGPFLGKIRRLKTWALVFLMLAGV